MFIVFEGGDGSGKTVQSKTLYEKLKKKKYNVLYTREPGETLFGKLLRQMLSHPDLGQPVINEELKQFVLMEPPVSDYTLSDVILQTAAPRSELLFFLLARSQLVDEVIQPFLSRSNNAIVICDRYIYSTVAYQGYGRGLNIDLIQEANKIATGGLQPDLVILLDLAPEEGLRRKQTPLSKDFFDDKEVEFHRKVRSGYLDQAESEPKRWLVIDGTLPVKKIEQLIWERFKPLLNSFGEITEARENVV